ncbi:MAG: phospho-N-acetylmuramoyl-pentapeptide-transferase [Atopobium sp.]|uniref:phospho-N-acetylmuramoyl-pentapeptide- transferase n=1 Tax=Atopobium sp. TaxID=1872650 RepID=UPI002A7EEC8B|nr:phospho-N-acetylmuramoyl-pentapeptide-transferase [Atopobium sp.]MDY4523236.1 phospho-N-acetylmuramoyl-pentapeptide-transferase [Atopobium sp.]
MFGKPSYPSYQVFLAIGLSAIIVLILMPLFIKLMRREGVGQQIRADGPQRHLIKQGTPTMGGVIILVAMTITCVLLARWTPNLMIGFGATIITALLGIADDIESVAHGRSLGLTPKQKMIGLFIISVTFGLLAVNLCDIAPVLRFPGGLDINLGILSSTFVVNGMTIAVPWLYIVFVFLLMAGMSNAVNLTDGLDGLSGGTVLVVMLMMAAVAFSYSEVNLAVFAASIAGGLIGFLWFNCYPASIFMGDTGSLAFGSAFAALAVLTKTEVVSVVMGGLFVVEALSVMIQVCSFKLTGKRVFLMAPIHHHFEKLGWSETKVVIRFWIISAACAAIGFALYFQLK